MPAQREALQELELSNYLIFRMASTRKVWWMLCVTLQKIFNCWLLWNIKWSWVCRGHSDLILYKFIPSVIPRNWRSVNKEQVSHPKSLGFETGQIYYSICFPNFSPMKKSKQCTCVEYQVFTMARVHINNLVPSASQHNTTLSIKHNGIPILWASHFKSVFFHPCHTSAIVGGGA